MLMEILPMMPRQRVQKSWILGIILALCWRLLHLLINTVDFAFNIANNISCHLISCGFLKMYESLQLDKLKHLAILIDNEEAVDVLRVTKLLRWLSLIGLKHVTFYDIDGVLKESKKILIQSMDELSVQAWLEVTKEAAHLDQRVLSVDLISLPNGKEGDTKAERHLSLNNLFGTDHDEHQTKQILTETDIGRGLTSVGDGELVPDLLLVFGGEKCHPGFPIWRFRYTEIVHMGKLKSLKFAAIVKVIDEFMRKR